MVIVDTSVWVDYFNNRRNPETDWLDLAFTREPVGLADLILCEVPQGLRRDEDFERVRKELEQLAVFPCAGRSAALAAARNFRSLRAQGITVRKTVDCLLATFCLEHGHAMLHRDRDFEHFERLGLQVIRASDNFI